MSEMIDILNFRLGLSPSSSSKTPKPAGADLERVKSLTLLSPFAPVVFDPPNPMSLFFLVLWFLL